MSKKQKTVGIEHRRKEAKDFEEYGNGLLSIEEAVKREEGREADWFDYVGRAARNAARAVLADPATENNHHLRMTAGRLLKHYIEARREIPSSAHKAAHHGYMVGELFAKLTKEYQIGKAKRGAFPNESPVSDDDIRAVVSDPAYPTRKAQAEKLGFEVRHLQKRLAKMK